jgi:flagellar motor switch protein FliN/FliY
MDNQANKKAAEEFAGVFATSLTESLTQAVGVPLQLKVLDSPDLGTRTGEPVHYRLTVGGALRGECYIELYAPHVAELGARILGKAASAYTEDHAEALGKVIAAASANEKTSIPVLLYFDGKFLTALSSQTLMQNASATEKVPVDPANLKLVMDVELNVLLRFGQRQLPLREVLDLASGSIVELDRQVDEPVELLLDGKVIARGEAVIVDGNYGLRVTEIPQPMASHFTN